ncbi:MAG TPA: asparagine synthetase B [Gemmatimonadota bacterium]|nr:asparagine synthetase B [Gemmatimonadota bacterium]
MLALGSPAFARSHPGRATPARSFGAAPFLIPMDAAQPEPLKAYGVVYRALHAGGSADWLLNFRGGAFLVDHPAAFDESLARGVMTEGPAGGTDEAGRDLAAALAGGEASALRLEVAPEIAVYVPPFAAPWDDAVRLALEFAEIPYRTVWDREVLTEGFTGIDWLHLHHEDFTAQYGKYGASVRASEWYREAVAQDREAAADLGFAGAVELKAAVASAIRAYVAGGGFLFAMCASTETLDLVLAGDPPDYGATLAFTGFEIERAPVGPFSSVDGHRVNTPQRLPLDAVQLSRFAPAVDPVAAMLTQNHSLAFPDWYGLTTSFRSGALKPGVLVLATCAEGRLAKYVHGDHGEGTFTFLGGHDPEDYQHAVGDPPTDLAFHPRSPGYRLILNNVLFPAARQEERKT